MRSTISDNSSTTAAGPSCSRTKCIRIKRKYRTDHSLRLPVSSTGDVSNEIFSSDGNDFSTRADSHTLEVSSTGVSQIAFAGTDEGASTISAHPQFCTPLIFQEHLRLMRWFRTGQFRLSYAMAMGNIGNVESQEPVNYCDSYSLEEIQELQEAHWDVNDEAELEGLLLKNLDYLYGEALKRIISYGYSAEEALSGLLKNGRCFGSKDVFSNIVENAMAYLTNKDYQDAYIREEGFMDLKQLGKHSIADMVRVLRQLRSSRSKGDAMWCLLMCDMNVVQASSLEEFDMAPFSEKSPLVLPTIPLSQLSAASSSSPSLTDKNNRAFQVKMVPQFSTPMDLHSGMLFQPGYRINSMPGTGASFISNETIPPECGSDMQVKNVILSKPIENASFNEGSKRLDNNYECALSMNQNIEKFQQLSLDTSFTLDDISCRDAGGLQPVPCNPMRVELSDTLSGACLLTGELNIPQNNGPDMLSVGHVTGTDAKLNMHMQLLGSAVSDQIGGLNVATTDFQSRSMSHPGGPQVVQPKVHSVAHHDTIDGVAVNVPATELSLAIASVVDSGVKSNFQELQTVMNNEAQNSSVNPIAENFDIRKDEMLMKFFHRVKELEVQLQECKDWAHQKAMQAACRFNKDMSELKTLRMEREEILCLKKDKQALEEGTMKRLAEMENALRKASAQVDRANAAVRKLEIENAEIRAEMEAAKLSAAESDATRQQVAKREKKSMKRAQAWEKQKSKLIKEFTAEKNKLAELHQQLSQAREQQHQVEVRCRQEEKSRDEAMLQADAERRAKEQLEATSKRKEDGLRRKVEVDFQRYRDDIKRLESELAHLRVATEASQVSSIGSASGEPTSPHVDIGSLHSLKDINARLFHELAELQESRRDVRRDRECVMCMSDEMSVVFLPCAHQVVCVKCNELHEKQGMMDCPSCRAPIQQRIIVFGINL